MYVTRYFGSDTKAGLLPWSNVRPAREELFGIERLEQHGRTLAAAQRLSSRPPRVPSLHSRLSDKATALLAAYRASAREVREGRSEVPAADWLPGFSATVTLRASRLSIPVSRGDASVVLLAGVPIEARAPVRVPIDGRSHDVQIVLSPVP